MTFRWPKTFRIILCFLIGSLLVTGISACQRQGANSRSDSQPVACHWVEHAAGKTCVPDQIKRLVTLDAVSFENAIALGLTPIATVEPQRSEAYLPDPLADVVDIGKSGEPSLESVLALKPDLIMGLGYHEGLYEQATQIAPTVLLSFDHSGLWKEAFQTYAQAVGSEEKGQQVMDAYRSRTQDFQQRFTTLRSSNLAAPFQVSVVRIYPDSINLYFRESFPGTVLQDAGLSRPDFQDISASEAQSRYQNPIQASISLESVNQADGDALFVWTSEDTAEAEQTARQKLAEREAKPLWNSLEAVQENKVYFVPSYWIGSGPLAANAILDDLFKHLL